MTDNNFDYEDRAFNELTEKQEKEALELENNANNALIRHGEAEDGRETTIY